MTLEDEAYQMPTATALRLKTDECQFRLFTVGDCVRDWKFIDLDHAIFPYEKESVPKAEIPILRHLWPLKTGLSNRLWFEKTQLDRGYNWWEYGHVSWEKFRTSLSIVFGFVATHNHFVLDRGGNVFNRSAPVIKLPATATEDDHLALLGLLNSSTACFWMKQIFFPKGGDHVGQEGARVRRTLWDERFEFTATGLDTYPVPSERPLLLSRQLDSLAQQLTSHSPDAVVRSCVPSAHLLAERCEQFGIPAPT